MKLLLDTHIFLWTVLEPTRLTPQAATAIDDPENEIWLSPISVWEWLVLAEKGRIILDPTPMEWTRNVLSELPLIEAPLNLAVAIESRSIQLPHQDPADRFLAATAKVYDLVLLSADTRMVDCPDLKLFG